jgi:serine phosphatase RsbU (regulator of sigma subunit)
MKPTGDRRRQLLGAGLATLWLVAVLIVDQTTPASFVPAVLYGVAPLIASAVLPPAATAGIGVAAVALTTASIRWNGTWGTPQTWIRISDVILVAAAGVVLAVARARREEQLARVSRIAEVAQRAVLPLIPTHVGPVAAGARYLSAAEDALVGGDLYDWFHSDRRICFIVGDVRGKGINAVEQAARVIRAFRQSAAGGTDLATAAAEMSAYIAPFLDDEEFVTAALVEVVGEQVTLVSCGHPQPLLIARDGAARLVDLPPCLPLGLGRVYESVTVPWSPGDRLLLYTDGLSEARDAHDEFLPVLPLAPLLHTTTVEAALDNVLEEVRRHVPEGRFTDDLAVLLLENAGGSEHLAVDPRDSLVRSPAPTPTRPTSPDASTAQPAPEKLAPDSRPTPGPAVAPETSTACCAEGVVRREA